jgi:hypothetical protein
MSGEGSRVIRSTLDDQSFSGLFDSPVHSFPYELPAGTDSVLDVVDVELPIGELSGGHFAPPERTGAVGEDGGPPYSCLMGRFWRTSS